jgi:predicted metal-dependent hydrolase
VPQRLSVTEVDEHVSNLVARLERTRRSSELDLEHRAARLAKKFDLPLPASVEWSSRQNSRWGSCTPAASTIRLSDRMVGFPDWVIDYVLVHELAHLVESNHSSTFHTIVDQYPLAERAEGFLSAVSLGHAGGLGQS